MVLPGMFILRAINSPGGLGNESPLVGLEDYVAQEVLETKVP